MSTPVLTTYDPWREELISTLALYWEAWDRHPSNIAITNRRISALSNLCEKLNLPFCKMHDEIVKYKPMGMRRAIQVAVMQLEGK